jgi:hypothetical protein
MEEVSGDGFLINLIDILLSLSEVNKIITGIY